MSKRRPFWLNKIEAAWEKRSVVWLSGVRRVGKTTLAKMIQNALYLNCDLPSTLQALAYPESFLASLPEGAIVIFDEVHRLADPSLLLKIAADEFPHLRVLATGSSTLAATKKFRDSLAGRKYEIYLSPILWQECQSVFGNRNLEHRLLHGGLPEAFLSDQKDPNFFSEWIDSFYARDIQELFSIRNRVGFLQLLQLLLRQSGGMLDYSNLAKHSGISRPTVHAHIEALSIAHAVFLLPPFFGGSRREITHRPKCYGFDTGFVTFAKGWEKLREEDFGLLWEHLVLDTLRAFFHPSKLYYWRNKSGKEIDFVVRNQQSVHAIECKINPDEFDPKALIVFRQAYREGDNFVLSPYVPIPFSRVYNDINVEFCSPENCRLFGGNA